jgi:nickel transport protein
VSLFAWVENDTVYTLSKFSGGKKVINGRLIVFDPAGNKLLEGVTDNQGEFAFKVPQKSELRLELIAGSGHKSHWRVPLEEITGGFAKDTATDAGPSKKIPASAHRSTDITADRLEAAIEKVLDRKLKPVMKMLADANQPGPSLTEIFGGIGYIIGLVGITAYFKSRQKK